MKFLNFLLESINYVGDHTWLGRGLDGLSGLWVAMIIGDIFTSYDFIRHVATEAFFWGLGLMSMFYTTLRIIGWFKDRNKIKEDK